MRKIHLIRKHPVAVLLPHGVFLQGDCLLVSRNTDISCFIWSGTSLSRTLRLGYPAKVIGEKMSDLVSLAKVSKQGTEEYRIVGTLIEA